MAGSIRFLVSCHECLSHEALFMCLSPAELCPLLPLFWPPGLVSIFTDKVSMEVK